MSTTRSLRILFRIGNLNGCYGYSTNVYGIAIGRFVIVTGKAVTDVATWIVDRAYGAK